MLQKINITIYTVLGLITIIIGGVAFFQAPEYSPVESADVVHIIREAGSASIFIGLVCFWCAFNYQKSKSIHYILMVFFIFLSIVHWWDFILDQRPFSSGLINSIPVVLLLFILSDKKRGTS